jgi:hypothetical protein
MRPWLNRQIPFDAVSRWWYFMVGGPAMGLVFSLATDFKPLKLKPLTISIVEGPPSHIEVATVILPLSQHWREDLLFTVVGLLLACGIIWMLEEIRAYNQNIPPEI